MRSTFLTRPNLRLPRLSTVWLLSSLAVTLWLGFDKDFRHDQSAAASTKLATSPKPTNLVPTTVVPIASIQVGQQVLADNPTGDRDLKFGETVDPPTWRKVMLKALKRDGSYADVTLLRPLTWLDEQHAAVGGTIKIDVPECGISGKAAVLAIEPCPPIEHDRRYRIVTGVFKHHSARIVEVHIEGLSEPIGTTANHPFWSEDRQDFVRADQLKNNERLRNLNGTARVTNVVALQDSEPVFNLEVQCDHVYRVTHSGVLVHNSVPLPVLTDCVLELFGNATHGQVPSPRPFGHESHHGVMSRWFDEHFGSAYNPNAAPTVVMSQVAHQAATDAFYVWRRKMKEQMGGRFQWSNVTEADMRVLAENMFDAAGVPAAVRQRYWQQFDEFLTSLP